MFKDIFELEDAKLLELTDATSEEQRLTIEEKYKKLLVELEEQMESDLKSSIEAEEKSKSDELNAQVSEDEKEVEQMLKEEKESEVLPEEPVIEEEEEVAEEEVHECEEWLISDMQEKFESLSDPELAKAYNKFEHQSFAKHLGLKTSWKEIVIVQRIKDFLNS